jgi:hypothetical protein
MIELCHPPDLFHRLRPLSTGLSVASVLSRGLSLRSTDWSSRTERIRLPDCGLRRITSIKQRSVTGFTPLN